MKAKSSKSTIKINDIDIRLIPMHPYPPPTPQMYPWCVVYTECTILVNMWLGMLHAVCIWAVLQTLWVCTYKCICVCTIVIILASTPSWLLFLYHRSKRTQLHVNNIDQRWSGLWISARIRGHLATCIKMSVYTALVLHVYVYTMEHIPTEVYVL